MTSTPDLHWKERHLLPSKNAHNNYHEFQKFGVQLYIERFVPYL